MKYAEEHWSHDRGPKTDAKNDPSLHIHTPPKMLRSKKVKYRADSFLSYPTLPEVPKPYRACQGPYMQRYNDAANRNLRVRTWQGQANKSGQFSVVLGSQNQSESCSMAQQGRGNRLVQRLCCRKDRGCAVVQRMARASDRGRFTYLFEFDDRLLQLRRKSQRPLQRVRLTCICSSHALSAR